MIKKITLGVLVLIILILNIWLVVRYYETENTNQLLLNTISQLGDENSVKTLFIESREREISLNGSKIKGSLSDLDKNELDVETITSNKLCFFFSSDYCMECIQTELLNMKEISLFNPNDIIVLIHTSEVKFAKIFNTNNSLVFKTYIIDKDFKPLLSEQKAPCYFVIEKDVMRINSSFFPSKEFPEVTISYLQEVYMKYF